VLVIIIETVGESYYAQDCRSIRINTVINSVAKDLTTVSKSSRSLQWDRKKK